MPRRPLIAALLVLAGAGVGGCGANGNGGRPILGRSGGEQGAAAKLGFPEFATKNTTRVGGADPVADAAAVALAVYPGGLSAARPAAVALASSDDWHAGIAAAVLMGPPLHAPLLLSNGSSLPGASSGALKQLDPGGAGSLRGAQVVRVGDVAKPSGYRATAVAGSDPFALGRAVDRLQARLAGKTSDRVLVVSSEHPEYAMPAAGWAAKAGDPILFVTRNDVPPETGAALDAHRQPKIYVLGPSSVISDAVVKKLRRLGTVTRISGPDPPRNAIAFARFADGPFGWGVVDPGHGLVFATAKRPLDAAAAAPLSASGTYGPLLVLDSPDQLSPAVVQYLLDIQPGYEKDPVRGVYNHGWLIGDPAAISLGEQSRIDALLQIIPVKVSTR